MSRNTTLEMLRNPKPYPHGTNGTTPPKARQPNRAFEELRKPQPYPSASQPTQRQPSQPRTGRQPPPSASQPRSPHNNYREPAPYPSASQPSPRSQPPPYTPVDRSTPQSPQYSSPPSSRPPSASQPHPSQNPQKKKPRVAVSAGAPKPYQPLRQPGHETPPVQTLPPSASQPRGYQPQRTPTQSPTPRDYTPSSTPRSTTPRSATPRSRTPSHQQPPMLTNDPHYSNNNIQPTPIYKNPPSDPGEEFGLMPSSGYSDVPDDRQSKRSYGRDIPSPESDKESGPASDRMSPYPEKKNGYDGFSDEIMVPKKSTSKHHLTPQHRQKDHKHRKIFVIVFIVLLVLALVLGLSLSNRGEVDYNNMFAELLGEQCDIKGDHCSVNGYSSRAVLMIALDGFRPEFLDESWQKTIPNIHRLAECGSVATNMEPSYPSTTYPNLYTLVTGLYPAVHGVIADYMNKDGVAGAFNPRDNPKSAILHDPEWYNGKPIWETAKEQDVITGSHSWIGNIVNGQSFGGTTVEGNPDYYVQHDPEIDFRARIQSALNWFTQSSNKAKFVNIYMEEPGNTIMKHGVESKQVTEALKEVDDAIGLFMENLVRDKATQCFDIIIVSTSGHLDVSCTNTTYFDQILPNTLHYDTHTNQMNSMAFFMPTADSPTDSDTAEELVSKLGCGNEPFTAFTRDTVPPKYHFFNPDREESAVVIMDDWHTYADSREGFDNAHCTGARGGYSTTNPEMKGVLIGFGPSFKRNYTRMEGFTNLQVYNLLSELIEITPEENNGTHGVLNDLLESPEVPLTDVDYQRTYFERDSCPYPATGQVNLRRTLLAMETGCTCTEEAISNLSPTVNINEKDQLLSLSDGRGSNLIEEEHSPLGEPRFVDVEGAIGQHQCRLVQSNYMTVFENKLAVPLVVAYKVKAQSNFQVVSNCLRGDLRLDPEDSPKCSSYDTDVTNSLPGEIRLSHLIQPSMAGNLDDKFNILITSNIVPMYELFVQEVWSPLSNWLRAEASGGRETVVIAGPVYDTNRDGVRDSYKDIALMSNAWVGKTPVPTHYFMVVTRCAQGNQDISLCQNEELEVQAFIFPHTNGIQTCDTGIEQYMDTYRASVFDVERITGLHLLSDFEDAVNLREEDLEWLMALKMSREPFRS